MKNKALIFLLACLVIAGCDSGPSNFQSGGSADEAPAVKALTVNAPPGSQQQIPTERKLIRKGNLSIEVSDVKKTKTAIDAICKSLNAYASSESQLTFDNKIQYNQTIRVAADKFDELVLKIEAEAKTVDQKNVNTEDVTEEFIDVEARLRTKKELETRYREILKQAKTVDEIMNIEGQIESVRSEIESMEGRLKYLTSQVAFSTLHVEYYESIGTDFGFGSKIGNAFSSGWDSFLGFLIGLISAWPFLIFLALIVWLVYRWSKHRQKKAQIEKD